MTADNKEQRVWVKFCFLLGKSATETVLMLQEVFKEEALRRTEVYEWYSRFKGGAEPMQWNPDLTMLFFFAEICRDISMVSINRNAA